MKIVGGLLTGKEENNQRDWDWKRDKAFIYRPYEGGYMERDIFSRRSPSWMLSPSGLELALLRPSNDRGSKLPMQSLPVAWATEKQQGWRYIERHSIMMNMHENENEGLFAPLPVMSFETGRRIKESMA